MRLVSFSLVNFVIFYSLRVYCSLMTMDSIWPIKQYLCFSFCVFACCFVCRYWHVLQWRTFYTIYTIGIGTWWITKVVCKVIVCFNFAKTVRAMQSRFNFVFISIESIILTYWNFRSKGKWLADDVVTVPNNWDLLILRIFQQKPNAKNNGQSQAIRLKEHFSSL